MLFRNSSPTSLVVRDCEIVGKAMLIRTGKLDREWRREVEKTFPAHILRTSVAAALNNLKFDDNEILHKHPQARERVHHLVNTYESVFTDKDIAVGHTELVNIDIKLVKEAVPVWAPVRRIKLKNCS